MKLQWLYLGSMLLLIVLAMLAGGCKNTEPENVSSRPWNSPRGYDAGLPGMYNPNR